MVDWRIDLDEVLQSKAADFEPSEFVDHYEQAVVELLKKKQAGLPAPTARSVPPPQNVVNLMDALRRSIAEGKKMEPARGGKRAAAKQEDLRKAAKSTHWLCSKSCVP